MTTTPAISPPARRSLGERMQQLATTASRPDADRVLRVVGPVLLPTGAILILLGWYGAANTTRVFLQIPYLISGGLLGLGLMFAGGFLYFTRWITDLLDESRRNADQARSDAERTAKALERIEDLLREVPLTGGTSAVVRPPAPAVEATAGLVATMKGSMVHRPECRLVEGRPTRPVASTDELGRCQVCRPPIG